MRKFTPGRSQRGISRFEVLVSTAIVMAFAAVLLQRLQYYQEQMEKVAMETAARQMDSALRIRAGELMLAGRSAELAALDGSDPFALFEVPPGRLAGPADAADTTGVWRYERSSGEVRYLPRNTRHLVIGSGAGPDGAIRYRAELLRVAPDGHFAGARLRCLTQYRWFEAES